MESKFPKTQITNDLSKFEGLALEEASDVLKAYMFQRRQTTFLKDAVAFYYDQTNGRVFLADAQLHVAMKNENGDLKQWATCQFCGAEGFRDSTAPKFINEDLCLACCVRDE